MLSDLPRDLSEDVLLRLPLTSLRSVRSVSKKWNTLFKELRFTKKQLAEAAREFLAVIVINSRVYLMSVNLHGDPSINHKGKLVSLTDSAVSVVYHCDGLLLCIMEHCSNFVVWNPYCGQTRLFKPISTKRYSCNYAIGYESSKSCRSYKVLRFYKSFGYVRYQLYYINSTDLTIPITIFPDWNIMFFARGVSLKGNTYWFAENKCLGGGGGGEEVVVGGYQDFLLSFDFTKERFGPHLSLPFQSYIEDTVTLSSVRDEQLAVLFQREDTYYMEIWITANIEPESVSWSKKVFLAVDMQPHYDYQFYLKYGSFFVDEENKVAVVFDYDGETEMGSIAYIIGENGYFKKVDFGEPSNEYTSPLMCSYVPSLVQIKRPARGGKRTRRQTKRKKIIEYL